VYVVGYLVLRQSVHTLASEWTTQHVNHMTKDVVSGWVVKVIVVACVMHMYVMSDIYVLIISDLELL